MLWSSPLISPSANFRLGGIGSKCEMSFSGPTKRHSLARNDVISRRQLNVKIDAGGLAVRRRCTNK